MTTKDDEFEKLKEQNAALQKQLAAIQSRLRPTLPPSTIQASRPSTDIVKARLDETGIPYRQEVGLISSPMATGKDLRFDYYLDQLRLAIEFDGAQHYHPVDFWDKGGKDEFANRRIYDKAKDEWCAHHGVSMLRLPYTLEVPELIAWIDKAINEAYVGSGPFLWLISPETKEVVSFEDRYRGVPTLKDGNIVHDDGNAVSIASAPTNTPVAHLTKSQIVTSLDDELATAKMTLTSSNNVVFLVRMAFNVYMNHFVAGTPQPEYTFQDYKYYMKEKGYKMGKKTAVLDIFTREMIEPYPMPRSTVEGTHYETVYWYLDNKQAKLDLAKPFRNSNNFRLWNVGPDMPGMEYGYSLPQSAGPEEADILRYYHTRFPRFAEYAKEVAAGAPWTNINAGIEPGEEPQVDPKYRKLQLKYKLARRNEI